LKKNRMNPTSVKGPRVKEVPIRRQKEGSNCRVGQLQGKGDPEKNRQGEALFFKGRAGPKPATGGATVKEKKGWC